MAGPTTSHLLEGEAMETPRWRSGILATSFLCLLPAATVTVTGCGVEQMLGDGSVVASLSAELGEPLGKSVRVLWSQRADEASDPGPRAE